MNLIVFNNKSSFSTVLSAFLNVAKDEFQQIDVYFPKFADRNAYTESNNISFYKPCFINKLCASITAFFKMFSKTACEDFKTAKDIRKISLAFYKSYYKKWLIAYSLYYSAAKTIKKSKDNVCVFSTWYDANAIAAAMVKKKYSNIKAMSYAHSYEVDFRKNRYTAVLGDRFKEAYLDKVLFISENVMNEYIDLNKSVLKHTDKYVPMHFGSAKKCEGIAKASDDGVFRLLSCSGISPVKRLDIIVNALEQYNGKTVIEWTHLGSGSEESKIRAMADKLSEKENVVISLKGSLSNDEVHKYYSEQVIDLFINVSASEGLPVSIMEAMSYGVPTIATDVGGNSEIVTDATGYLVSADITSNELAELFEKITQDVNCNTVKKDAAYKMWQDNYQINDNIVKLLELF